MTWGWEEGWWFQGAVGKGGRGREDGVRNQTEEGCSFVDRVRQGSIIHRIVA